MNDVYSKKYNNNRKNILTKLSRNIQVSNKELYMFGLTPYYNLDNSLDLIDFNSFYIEMTKVDYKISHVLNKDVYFSPPQKQALEFLNNNRRVIFSAPTSFGKTLVVKEYIATCNFKYIVIIVPTNALSYELEKSFKENSVFNRFDIFNIVKEDLFSVSTENKIFIGTQEKFLELSENLKSDIDLLIIDEAYKLQDSLHEQRAYKLSSVLLEYINVQDQRIILLTPQSNVINYKKYNFEMYSSSFNHVDKVFKVLNYDSFFDSLIKNVKYEKSILYCESPNFKKIFPQIEEINFNVNLDLQKLISYLSNVFTEDWDVVKLLKKGILTHHGAMPKFLQNRMIDLYNGQNDYNLLIGTRSISEGINTSTKNIYLNKGIKIKNNDILIKNTIGRAGRLGQYPIGFIYSTQDIEETLNKNHDIILAIDNELERLEIENSNNDEEIKNAALKYNVSEGFIKDTIKKSKFSLNRVIQTLKFFKADLKYNDIGSLVVSLLRFHRIKEMSYAEARFCLITYLHKGNYFYINDFRHIINFKNAILYLNARIEEYNDTLNDSKKKLNPNTINLYIKFIYNTFKFNILPYIEVGIDLKTKEKQFIFGEFVESNIDDIYERYMIKVGIDKSFTSVEMKVLKTLQEYGVNLNSYENYKEIIKEICSNLKIRFSMFDIKKTLEKICKESNYRTEIESIISTFF